MIIGLGGGKGLSRTLLALKQQGLPFGAVVETTDNGGSTGKLRREHGVPAMGDVRRVIDTVSDSPFAEAMEYRFNDHAVGNLVLLKLMKTHGFSSAVQIYRKAMGLSEPVEPLFNEACDLVAYFNGTEIFGEVQVDSTPGRINSLKLHPVLEPNPKAVELVETADAVVVGPGSLFTSILPHFLVPEIRKAVSKVPRKIFILNIVNDVTPVQGFTSRDYLNTLKNLGGFTPDTVVAHGPSKGLKLDLDDLKVADVVACDGMHDTGKLGGVLCQLLR
ncbi:MAG TPA: hypothetical protein ENN60_03435 [archaeon]|nr:hypothetical protein [archaeon]